MHINIPSPAVSTTTLIVLNSLLLLGLLIAVLLAKMENKAFKGTGIVLAGVLLFGALGGWMIMMNQREDAWATAVNQLQSQTLDKYGVSLSDVQAGELLSQRTVELDKNTLARLRHQHDTYQLVRFQHAD